MKFKNIKSGEIKDWTFPEWLRCIMNPDNSSHGECDLEQFIKNVDTFSQHWRKYEKHEEHEYFWYISPTGTPIKSEVSIYDPLEIHLMKQIGNYFESEEDADKAVEKQKAWKRLKDKGLRFTGYLSGDGAEVDRIYAKFPYGDDLTDKDLDLLFSGGEEWAN